jgi:hypothetical protein
METPKYKIGDVVRINSRQWYKDNRNSVGLINKQDNSFVPIMEDYCGFFATITEVQQANVIMYKLDVDHGNWNWSDWMFENCNNGQHKESCNNEQRKVLWLAKDGGTYKNSAEDVIGVYQNKPTEEEDMPFWEGDLIANIPAKLFPELTFENSPKQVEFKIIDNENN